MMASNKASEHFNQNWDQYLDSVNNNTLYHNEMMGTLKQLLNDYVNDHAREHTPTFVDLGCGDCSKLAPILKNIPITKYIGIDGAEDVLKRTKLNTAQLSCEKVFICNDMITGLEHLQDTCDIIFSSYAVHHLHTDNKKRLIQHCYNKLNTNGLFILVDGVLKKNQTRDEWLDELESRINTTNKITSTELASRMAHPRADDYPDSISTFENIAKQQGWRAFNTLFNIDIYAFMVFYK